MSDVVDMTSGVYRRVYAGYITGHRINGLSLEAEAWFWRLNAVADDYGNMRAEPSLLVAETVGLRQIKTEKVLALVDEIVAAGLAYRYQVGRDQYLHIVGFEERQPCGRNGRRFKRHPLHPDAPSCIPVNPGESGGIQNNPGAPIPTPIPIPIPIPTPISVAACAATEVQWSPSGWVGINDADKAAWLAAYPACDIDRQLAAMGEWLKANPKKAIKSNYRRFITNWLSRSQDHGGDTKSNGSGAFGGRTSGAAAAEVRRSDKRAREFPEPDEPLPIVRFGSGAGNDGAGRVPKEAH